VFFSSVLDQASSRVPDAIAKAMKSVNANRRVKANRRAMKAAEAKPRAMKQAKHDCFDFGFDVSR